MERGGVTLELISISDSASQLLITVLPVLYGKPRSYCKIQAPG